MIDKNDWQSRFKRCYRDVNAYVLLGLTLIPGLIFFGYAWSQSTFAWLIGLLCLGWVAVVSAIVKCNNRYVYWIRVVAMPWTILILVLTPVYYSRSTDVSRWERKDGAETISYADTYSRFGHKLLFRSVTFSSSDGPTTQIEGPIAGDDRQHGKWETKTFGAPKTIQYYWYGDPITEGEWHLRNR